METHQGFDMSRVDYEILELEIGNCKNLSGCERAITIHGLAFSCFRVYKVLSSLDHAFKRLAIDRLLSF